MEINGIKVIVDPECPPGTAYLLSGQIKVAPDVVGTETLQEWVDEMGPRVAKITGIQPG